MRFSITIILLVFCKFSFGQYSRFLYAIKLKLPNEEVISPPLPQKYDGVYYRTDSTTIEYEKGRNIYIENFTVNKMLRPPTFYTANYIITLNYKKPCVYFVRVIDYHKESNEIILGFYANRDSITNKYFLNNEEKRCFYSLTLQKKNDTAKMVIDFVIKTNYRDNIFNINYCKGAKLDFGLLTEHEITVLCGR